MIPRPAQRTANFIKSRYLQALLIEYSTPWLLKRIKVILLRRQITKTARAHFHVLRTTGVPATRGREVEITRDLEVGAAREVGEAKGIEGMEQGEEVGVGSIRRKKSGAQNGRMSIRLPPHFIRTDYSSRNPVDRRARNTERAAKRQKLDGKEEDLPVYATKFSKEEIETQEKKPKRKVAVMLGYSGTGYKGMQL